MSASFTGLTLPSARGVWPPPLWGTRPPRAEQETLPLLQIAGFLATVKGTWNSGAAAGGEHMPRKPLTVPVPRKYRAEPGKARSASAGLLPPRRGAAGGKSNASCAARALPPYVGRQKRPNAASNPNNAEPVKPDCSYLTIVTLSSIFGSFL